MIDVILLRQTTLGGVSYLKGDRVSVEPSRAAELMQSARARLADPADLALVLDARQRPRRGRIVGHFVVER